MKVDLLADVHLEKDAIIEFANGDRLPLPKGKYWTCAFGVVVDLDAHRCIATPAAAWKLR